MVSPTSAEGQKGITALGPVAVASAAISTLFQPWVNRSGPRVAAKPRGPKVLFLRTDKSSNKNGFREYLVIRSFVIFTRAKQM